MSKATTAASLTSCTSPLYDMLKKAAAQIAHLVFADTQSDTEKPKELFANA
ncbi:hypothetical protein [Pontibacter rugosus]|uniref:Uncharacterized protein n=1 Tax=Pontibacter rugosus TaxID=1745966 RepID=A0ABW3SW82_9BACT